MEAITAWKTTYTINLAIDGVTVTALEWYMEECGPELEAPGDSGSRNAAVRVEPAPDKEERRVSLTVHHCDAIVRGGVPTGPAEDFRLYE